MTDGTMGIMLTPERYLQLLEMETNFKAFKQEELQARSKPNAQQDVEKELNTVPQNQNVDTNVKAPERPKFEYDGKQYELLAESNIKVRGIFDKLFAHPLLAPYMSQVPKETLDQLGAKWLPVTVYRALYKNVDGDIWVRMQEEFAAKFKRVK